ncbi:MAG: hypothetical protein ACOY4R_19930 [Pseudomonadota bacterium]
MMRFLLILMGIVSGLLAARAGQAQECMPDGRAKNPGYERYHADDRRDEALRIRRHERLVSREGDQLRLVLDGGGTLALVDCPYGADGRWYLFERYDQPGRFHVVRTQAPEDFSYTLVMMPTGRTYTVHGSPVWAPEKTRFLTIACTLEPPRATLLIQAPAGEALATESEVPLPCETESCSARWDHESWISVACTPRDASMPKGTEFVLMRGSDGVWNRFGR